MPLLPLDHFRFPDAVTLHLCRFSAASPVPAIERARVSSLGKHPRKPRGLNVLARRCARGCKRAWSFPQECELSVGVRALDPLDAAVLE